MYDSNGMSRQVIQRFILPSLELSADEKLYVRSRYNAYASRERQEISFFPGGVASFDTLFNGLTVERWKQDCGLETLALELEGAGRFQVRIGLHRIGHATRWLREATLTLATDEPTCLELAEWVALEAGILFIQLRALGEATFIGARWVTQDSEKRSVDLGIVVTHFNRKQAVVPAIRRINEQVTANLGTSGSIRLVVVDNSRNLEPSEAEGATVIPSPNLGGSGGFTRGLMHLQDNGFSHCLFMDDDASCEIESIRRTHTYMSYVCDERVALSGSMLREVESYRLFEKGARFDGVCHPLKNGLDMRRVRDLLEAECNDRHIDYGGWWFFAFTIAGVKHLAFPFFVRGDDIMFSMQNGFNIKTMNGIATWGDDFSFKSSPFTWYLDVRNHLVQKLSHMDAGFFSTAKVAIRFFAANVFSYNYSSARAIIKAVDDVAKGPQFWKENLDTSRVREEIGAYTPSEKMTAVYRADHDVRYGGPKEGVVRKVIRAFTVNGYLVPGFLMKNATILQRKGYRANFREVFLFERVLYEYPSAGMGYIAEHNKTLFLKECCGFFVSLLYFLFKFRALKRSYRSEMGYMTSRTFWREIFDAK
ncbi:hypothetical protein GY26_14915 [Gammaproteobacteria bacterium MFB021]|nr:hypothetical protein GY26_14915 [Gammaproteobacteria bacterium MFB021]